MKSNDKRKSYLIIFLTFVFCSICKELGEFIIKGETQIQTSSYSVVIGAGIGYFILMIFSKKS
jgi:hypothetical protein